MYPTWFINDILKSIRLKHNLFRISRYHNDADALRDFNELRKQKNREQICYKNDCSEVEYQKCFSIHFETVKGTSYFWNGKWKLYNEPSLIISDKFLKLKCMNEILVMWNFYCQIINTDLRGRSHLRNLNDSRSCISYTDKLDIPSDWCRHYWCSSASDWLYYFDLLINW